MIKKILLGLLLTTILTGCEMSKGTTISTTENNETTTQETTTVEIETEETTTATEAPTEPPTKWEESIDWSTREEMKEALDKLQVSDSIQAVILEYNTVIDTSDGKEKTLNSVVTCNEWRLEYIDSIRTVDMDQDGIKELILEGSSKEEIIAASYMVLKECYDGKVVVYSFGSIKLTIAETGYIDGSSGASRGGVFKLVFDGYDVKMIELAEYDYEYLVYIVDEKEVSLEEFQKFMEPHDFDNCYINSNTIRIYYLLEQ